MIVCCCLGVVGVELKVAAAGDNDPEEAFGAAVPVDEFDAEEVEDEEEGNPFHPGGERP